MRGCAQLNSNFARFWRINTRLISASWFALIPWTIALICGAAAAFSFPRPNWDGLSWVCWIPLLFVVTRMRLTRRIALSWLAGVVMFTISLRWITETMINYGGMSSVMAYLTLVLLTAYLAIYPAGAIVGSEWLYRQLRLPFLATLPILWVAGEWVRGIALTGFPWNLMGYAAWQRLPLIQVAEYTGVHGISWLMMASNAAIADVSLERNRRALARLVCFGIALGVLILAGSRVLQTQRPVDEPLQIALVQGNISQDEKWSPQLRARNARVYVELTTNAFAEGAEVVIWPEAAIGVYHSHADRYRYSDSESIKDAIASVVPPGRQLILGTPDLDGKGNHYNGALILGERGEIQGRYLKQHLVPFGEYVPLRKLLFFVDKITPLPDDFTAGADPSVLEVRGVPTGIYICYETAFPDLLREFRARGAQMLINLTNDAWFGLSDGPYQHFAMTIFRAVESRVPIVRCANTGISGIVDPWGRVLSKTNLLQRTVLQEKISPAPGSSFYAHHGALWAHINLGLTALLVAFAWRRKSRNGAQ